MSEELITESPPEEAQPDEQGRIKCAGCGKRFTPGRANQKYHSKKCRDKASKDRSKGTTKPKTSSVRRSLWLARKEAEIIGYIIQYFVRRKTGLALTPPPEERREHLVYVIKKLEAQPPFSYIQQFLYRLFPVFDPEAKPGRSVIGDTAQYLWGWYEQNPEIQQIVGASVPPVFQPDGTAAPQEEYRETVSYEEYMRSQGAPEADPMASYRTEANQ